MKEYLKTFLNPPKGGNGRGVPTINPMAVHTGSRTVQAQPSGPNFGEYAGSTRAPYLGPIPGSGPMPRTLRGNFENGVFSARAGIVESHYAGAPDFRNFNPGARQAQTVSDVSPISAYDYESERKGSPEKYTFRTVTPVLEPDTSMPYRIDGKPNSVMPR